MKARDDLYPEARQATSLRRVAPKGLRLTQYVLEQHPASPGLERTGETNRTPRHPKAIGRQQGGTEKNRVKGGHITASSITRKISRVIQALRHDARDVTQVIYARSRQDYK